LKWWYDNYKTFYPPDVKLRSFKEVMEKFGKFIDMYGTREYISYVIVLIGEKL